MPASDLLQQNSYGPWSVINQKLTTTMPHFIRTGDNYFTEDERKIMAILNACGIPTLFITINFSERWPVYKRILSTTGLVNQLPSDRPWDAVQYYYERLYWLKKEFLRSMECMVLLLSFSIFYMTSGSMYLPTAIPSMRTSTVKPVYLLEQDPENSYFANALEKYFARLNAEGPERGTYFKYFSKYLVCTAKQGTRKGWKDLNGYFVYHRAKVYISSSKLSY